MTRYKLILVLAILFIGLTAFCQSKFKYGVEFSGIQNFYKQTSNKGAQSFLIGNYSSATENSSLGFNFRFTYLVESGTSVSVSPGIRLLKNFNDLDISQHKATFLDLPIQVNLLLLKNLYMIAGARFSYLSRFERTDGTYIFNPPRNSDLLPFAVHRLFYMPKLGIGVNIIKSLNIEISYNYSFTSLILVNDSFGISSTPTTYKSDFLQLSIVYIDLGALFQSKRD